jgi:hypothetical protein
MCARPPFSEPEDSTRACDDQVRETCRLLSSKQANLAAYATRGDTHKHSGADDVFSDCVGNSSSSALADVASIALVGAFACPQRHRS